MAETINPGALEKLPIKELRPMATTLGVEHVATLDKTGLASAIVEAIENLAADLAGRPQIPLASVKRVLNTAGDAPLRVGLELEGQAFEKIRFGPEFEHGVDAFLKKEKPDFSYM